MPRPSVPAARRALGAVAAVTTGAGTTAVGLLALGRSGPSGAAPCPVEEASIGPVVSPTATVTRIGTLLAVLDLGSAAV